MIMKNERKLVAVVPTGWRYLTFYCKTVQSETNRRITGLEPLLLTVPGIYYLFQYTFTHNLCKGVWKHYKSLFYWKVNGFPASRLPDEIAWSWGI